MPSSVSGDQKCALDRKSTRLNSSHTIISYAVFCLNKNMLQYIKGFLKMFLVKFSFLLKMKTYQSALSKTCCSQNFCMIFFFNDTATTEIYTPFPTRRSSDHDTATTEIYTLSLHDALPISVVAVS